MRVPGHRPTCAVTGASGYVGSALCAWLRERGWLVYELRHRVEASDRAELVRPYALEAGPRSKDLEGVDALVHCAHDFRWTRWSDIERVNVAGGIRLFEAAKAAGVRRLVFISSLSAFPGCRSLYGRAKIDVENAVAHLGGVSIRPGLVWGGAGGGMMAALAGVVGRAPIVPVLGGGRQTFYPVHIDDLCRLVEEVCRREKPNPAEPLVAAVESGVTFRDVLKTLASSQGRRVALVPVPWRPVWLALWLAERAGVSLGFRSDSVFGFVEAGPRPDIAETRRYTAPFRPFGEEPRVTSCAAS